MSWIYRLNKDELAKQLANHAIDTEGSLDDLRKRMSHFSKENPHLFPAPYIPISPVPETEGVSANSPLPWGGKIKDKPPGLSLRDTTGGKNHSVTDHIPESPPRHRGPGYEPTPNELEPNAPLDTVKIMSQIRKWGCVFDGKDLVAFLERLRELRRVYGFSNEHLLRGMPELLRGDALLWYRISEADWETWEEFCRAFREQFFPAQYAEQLRREIQGRIQKDGEPFNKFAIDILTKMRRAEGFTQQEQLDRLYANMHPDYKLYIDRDAIYTLGEFQRKASRFEQIEHEKRERRTAKEQVRTAAAATTAYNREECCWRCKQRGHVRADCRRPPRKFCSSCGRDGVLTRDCHPPPENSFRAESNSPPTRPTE